MYRLFIYCLLFFQISFSNNNSVFVKFNDINWEKIKDKALVIMLKRYIEEANQGDFAVYMGNETTGLTQTLK